MNNYERYKLTWMLKNNHSLKEMLEYLFDLSQAHPEDSFKEVYEEWEEIYGFHGELWATEKTFQEEAFKREVKKESYND